VTVWSNDRGGGGRLIDDQTIRSDDNGFDLYESSYLWGTTHVIIILPGILFLQLHALIPREIEISLATVVKVLREGQKRAKIIDHGMWIYMFRKGLASICHSDTGNGLYLCGFIFSFPINRRRVVWQVQCPSWWESEIRFFWKNRCHRLERFSPNTTLFGSCASFKNNMALAYQLAHTRGWTF